jgi:hypothetical protein
MCRMVRLLAVVALSVTFLCTWGPGWLLAPGSALVVALVETGLRERRPVRLVRRPGVVNRDEEGEAGRPAHGLTRPLTGINLR